MKNQKLITTSLTIIFSKVFIESNDGKFIFERINKNFSIYGINTE